VRWLWLFAVTLYTGYLVYVGLTLMLFPWHEAWTVTVVRLPPHLAATLDLPWVRGLVSGFGALHLVLLAAELVSPRGLRGQVTHNSGPTSTPDAHG
jgi:hypothetical protein